MAETVDRVEAGPVETPWGDTNVRVRAPDGMQLTLFATPSGAGAS